MNPDFEENLQEVWGKCQENLGKVLGSVKKILGVFFRKIWENLRKCFRYLDFEFK